MPKTVENFVVVDGVSYYLTRHVAERFVRRFKGHDVRFAVQRSVKLTTRQFSKCSGSDQQICAFGRFDPESGACFVCKAKDDPGYAVVVTCFRAKQTPNQIGA